MPPKIILFDADGVVIHSEMFGDHWEKTNGLVPEDMKPFYKGVFSECLVGRADLKVVIEPWLAKWKWTGTVDEFLLAWFAFENKVDPRVTQLIARLRASGVRCYLATNQEKYRTAYMRHEMRFDQVFDGVFSSAEMGVKKPAPEYYEQIVQALGADKKDMLYVDDTVANVEAARAMGIESVVYEGSRQTSPRAKKPKGKRRPIFLKSKASMPISSNWTWPATKASRPRFTKSRRK
jgi:putative hydrolase of the HAD superfamily